MVNRPKIKGTAAETAIVRYLNVHGFPHAERRALAGAVDKGDVSGVVGWVVESKDTKADAWGPQLAETTKERDNAGADHGVLIRKRRGTTDVGRWFAVMEVEDLVRLMREAGYGDQL